MKQKKIHSILIIGIMLFSLAFIFSPTVNAVNPHAIKGIVYVNGEIPESPVIENMMVKIEFTTVTETSEVYKFDFHNDSTNYNVGFQGYDGETGDIIVEYYGIDYIPTDNASVTIESSKFGYYIILHIEPPEDLPPSKVTGLSVNDAKDGKLNLAWTAATDDNGVSYYNIYRTGTGLIGTATSTNYQDTGLTNGQSYEYQVSAVDTIGQEGELSDPASGTPTATTSGGGGGGGSGGGGGGGSGSGGGTTTSNLEAKAGGPYYGFVNEEISLTGSATKGTSPYAYAWDLDNDGQYDDSTEQNPTYSWGNPGTYTIELKVTDDDGNSDSSEATVIISLPNNNPSDPIVSNEDGLIDGEIGTINNDYKFTAISTDADGDDIKYTFDWDDTTDNTVKDFTANNTLVNATHNWTTAGLYVLGVKAEDNNGGVSGTTKHLIFIDIDYEIQADGTYYLDTDRDGSWDQIYNPETGLFSDYEEPPDDEPADERDDEPETDNTMWYIVGLIIVIVLILLAFLGTRKKEQPKKPKK